MMNEWINSIFAVSDAVEEDSRQFCKQVEFLSAYNILFMQQLSEGA